MKTFFGVGWCLVLFVIFACSGYVACGDDDDDSDDVSDDDQADDDSSDNVYLICR